MFLFSNNRLEAKGEDMNRMRTSTWEICHTEKDITFVVGNLAEFCREAKLKIEDVRSAIVKGRAQVQNWADVGPWRIFWHYLDKESIKTIAQTVETPKNIIRHSPFKHLQGRQCFH